MDMTKVTIVKNYRNAETLKVFELSEVISMIQKCEYAEAIDPVRGISLHTELKRLRTSEHVQSVRTAKFSQLNEAILG